MKTFGRLGRFERNFALMLACGAVMSAAGCECGMEESGLTKLRPEIRIFDPRRPDVEGVSTDLEISFGEVPLGATAELAIGARNIGKNVLHVCVEGSLYGECGTTATAWDPSNGPFAHDLADAKDAETATWILAAGGEGSFHIRFAPTMNGETSATLTLSHDGKNGPTTVIRVSGTGVAPRIVFDADQLDFGEVTVDRRKEVLLRLTNETQFSQPVSVLPLDQTDAIFGTTGPSGSITSMGDTLEIEVPGNGSTDLTVWFRPPIEGPHENTLALRYCGAGAECDHSVGLRGIGIRPTFEIVPATLDFGEAESGTPVTRRFEIRNTGNFRLEISSIAVENGTTNEFTPNPGGQFSNLSLEPTATLPVEVTYVGSGHGVDEGRIEVATNAWDDPNTPYSDANGYVSLVASSIAPDIEALPRTINFSTVPVNGAPANRTLILTNVGNSALTVSEVRLETSSSEISLVSMTFNGSSVRVPPNRVLAPGEAIELRLEYAPVDAGADTGRVIVTSNDPAEGTLEVAITGIGGIPTTCSIVVAPSQLTFGLVERGRVATLPVEVRNSGAQPCSARSIRLGGDTEFSIAAGSGDATIAPGTHHRIDIVYSPTQYGSHQATLEFDSDDPAQMAVSVPVTGASQQTDVLVIPSELDFSVVPVTCRSPNRSVTIYNTGSSQVTVSSVYLDPSTSNEFELSPYASGTTIRAGQQSVIGMRYHPRDIGPDTGLLFVSHSAATQPVAVPLMGNGQVNPTVTDRFSQLPTPQADVLFIVDNSGSMSEEQANLGANLGAFLTFADVQGIDYQIGVTTTDVYSSGEHGQFTGANKIITPSTPNRDRVFAQNVNNGTNGSSEEEGLEAAYLALSDPNINVANAGFLRNDAALAVIFVSDEEDQSPRSTGFYENFLKNIKGFGNSSLFSASAVVGTDPSGCYSVDGEAEYGSKYIGLARATGGVVESICNSNWGQSLSNIGLNSFGLKRQFQLTAQPVPVTIAVTVDGTSMPSSAAGGQVNWTYDSTTNTVTFSPARTPEANAQIEVTYTVACLP